MQELDTIRSYQDTLASVLKQNQYMKLLLTSVVSQAPAIETSTITRIAEFLELSRQEARVSVPSENSPGLDWFKGLPREVVLIVLSCLDYEDISRIAVTCKALAEFSRTEELWARLAQIRWKEIDPNLSPLEIYRMKHVLETRWFTARPVVSTMTGYKGTVTAISFLPGTTTFFASSDDGSAGLWDYQEQSHFNDLFQQHHRQTKVAFRKTSFWGHGGPVWGCAITQTGKLATGSSDKTVKIWNLAGKCEATLRGHHNWVTCIAAQGEVLASGSYDATVKLWDVEARNELVTMSSGLENHIYTIDLFPGVLVTGCLLGSVNLWDLTTSQVATQFVGHEDAVSTVKFSEDGDLVASGSKDRSVRLWDRRSGLAAEVLISHTSNVMCLDFDTQANRLVSGSHDKTIHVWDLRRVTTPRNILHGHSAAVFCLKCSDNKIISGSSDKTVKVWNFHN